MVNPTSTVDAQHRHTAIIDSIDQATSAWLTNALQAAGVLREGEVTEVTSELMNVGQLGFVARLNLAYDSAESNAPPAVMLKLPSNDAGSRGLGMTLGFYEAEVGFYQQIAPTVRVRVPLVYHADIEPETGRFTLLLEDLSSVAAPGDMIAGGTVEQAAQALDGLTALHAPRWSDPSLAELTWLANPQRLQNFFAGVEPMLPSFLERFGDRLDTRDVALAEQAAPHANSWAARATHGRKTVLHGDYRMDNLFFPTGPGQPVAVIDWQAAQLGPPLIDVSVYLGGCLSLEDRRVHERDLLRRYQNGLVSGGVTDFSFDDAWESYRWCAFYGFMLSIPMAIQLERSERGDALFAGMFAAYAHQVRDLGSMELLK
jgi:Phosphotransferase enzyme family